MRRLFVSMFGLVLLLTVSPASATTFGPPYDDSGSSHYCSEGLGVTTGVTATCSGSASATKAGTVTGQSSIASRLQTYAPTYASGYSDGGVTQGYELTEQTPALRVTATVHVNQAHAGMYARPAGVGTGSGGAFINVSIAAPGGCFYTSVFCFQSGGPADIVTVTMNGEADVAGDDFTASALLIGCGGIPLGPQSASVTVSTAAGIGSLLTPSAGWATASVDAVITGITFEPASADGYC